MISEGLRTRAGTPSTAHIKYEAGEASPNDRYLGLLNQGGTVIFGSHQDPGQKMECNLPLSMFATFYKSKND